MLSSVLESPNRELEKNVKAARQHIADTEKWLTSQLEAFNPSLGVMKLRSLLAAITRKEAAQEDHKKKLLESPNPIAKRAHQFIGVAESRYNGNVESFKELRQQVQDAIEEKKPGKKAGSSNRHHTPDGAPAPDPRVEARFASLEKATADRIKEVAAAVSLQAKQQAAAVSLQAKQAAAAAGAARAQTNRPSEPPKKLYGGGKRTAEEELAHQESFRQGGRAAEDRSASQTEGKTQYDGRTNEQQLLYMAGREEATGELVMCTDGVNRTLKEYIAFQAGAAPANQIQQHLAHMQGREAGRLQATHERLQATQYGVPGQPYQGHLPQFEPGHPALTHTTYPALTHTTYPALHHSPLPPAQHTETLALHGPLTAPPPQQFQTVQQPPSATVYRAQFQDHAQLHASLPSQHQTPVPAHQPALYQTPMPPPGPAPGMAFHGGLHLPQPSLGQSSGRSAQELALEVRALEEQLEQARAVAAENVVPRASAWQRQGFQGPGS